MTQPIPPNSRGKWEFEHPHNIWDHITIAMIKDFPIFRTTTTHANRPDPTFQDASIDGIATYHMLDHLHDPRPLMREVERVLRDDAWFVNIVPHYSSELWHADFDHKTQFALDSWKNMIADTHYANQGEWQLRVGFNMIMGFTERNVVMVTQLIRIPRGRQLRLT